MHALADRSWNEKLPSACAALTVQAGLFALLLASFRPATGPAEAERETIFLLPRLAPRPVPVIDARTAPRAAPAPSGAPALPVPEIPPPPPPYTQALPGNPDALAVLRGALACKPDAQGQPSPLPSCQGLRPRSRNELAALAPALPVKREAQLAAERARERAPLRVPCVSMQTNNMGFGQEEHAVMVDPFCALGELMR
jgi:hypothetical protein